MSVLAIVILSVSYVLVGLVIGLLYLYYKPPSAREMNSELAAVVGTVALATFLWPILAVIFAAIRVLRFVARRGRDRARRIEEETRVEREQAEMDNHVERGGVRGGFADDGSGVDGLTGATGAMGDPDHL